VTHTFSKGEPHHNAQKDRLLRSSMEIHHECVGSTSIDTHTKPWLKRIWAKHQPHHHAVVIDPFARNCGWATLTNDIDPTTRAEFHMDALDFLKTCLTSSAEFVIFDPPFSARQAAQKYESGHVNVYATPGYVKSCMNEIVRILKPGGTLMKLGFNSTRHDPSLEATHLYYINSGGNHNDVCCSIWRFGNEKLGVE